MNFVFQTLLRLHTPLLSDFSTEEMILCCIAQLFQSLIEHQCALAALEFILYQIQVGSRFLPRRSFRAILSS